MIVAESLETVSDPLLTAIRTGPPRDADEVVANLAKSLLPEEAQAESPAWLRPTQQRTFRRLLAALERQGGALLSDPVGSGKTFVALAVARAWNGGRATTCFVPAGLLDQWDSVARRLDLEVRLWSHERTSRGRLPPAGRGLVLIDESHHFRHAETRRYAHLSPWLVGHPVLLLSATPIVNGLADLVNQLLLTVRDDILLPRGIPSLSSIVSDAGPITALGELLFSSNERMEGRPRREERRLASPEIDEDLLAALDGLTLSRHPAVARLVRGTLWRAAASSPAALHAALTRYDSLLRHAADARAAGRPMDRRALHAFVGGAEDQLVFWALFDGPAATGELALEDADRVTDVLHHVAMLATLPDAKLDLLEAILADGRRTLIFTTAIETVRYLRNRLHSGPLAWCTGDTSGIGRWVLPRRSVLGWFAPAPVGGVIPAGAPRHLVTTDVSAEGLDLQGAERIVHYDLPWTSVRLDQRDGRAIRLGSDHARVEVVRFEPPPSIERRIEQMECLERKKSLPARVGLGDAAEAQAWPGSIGDRLLASEKLARFHDVRPIGPCGVAGVFGEGAGALVGFRLGGRSSKGSEARWSTVGWIDDEGGWSEASDRVESALRLALEAPTAVPPSELELARILSIVGYIISGRLSLLQRSRWAAPAPGPEARQLIRRLRALAADAARRRDNALLPRLERALRFAASGHTAGERALISELATSSTDLIRRLDRLPPPSPSFDPLPPVITGIIVFRKE